MAASAAFLAGYYGLPYTRSPHFVAGYLAEYRRDAKDKAWRDRVVTEAIETGFRSGIDSLVRYGLDASGKKITGYFMADRDAYYFQIAGDTVSYKKVGLRRDSWRSDRGPFPPKPGTKKKTRNCNIGLECGRSCINQKKTCRIKLQQDLQNEVEQLRAQLAAMEGQLAQAQAKKPAKAGDVRDEALSDLNFDPKRFQYKLLPGETGATGSLTGVRKWDPNLAGVVQVWKDPEDGKTYIVNGHNRATLANKLGVDEITVRYLDAKNAAEARSIGALVNIAEGHGSPLDAAKFFRDTGMSKADIQAKGLPLQEKVASDGLAIAALEDTLFRRVVDGRLPMQRAAVIGASGLDHPQQKALMEMIETREKRGKVTNDTVRELADIVKSSETQTEFTLDLFGSSESQKSMAIDKAETQSKIRQRLSRERRLFSTVGKSRSAQELERGGNQINVEQSANIAEETQQALRTFDKMKNVTGGISDEINETVRQISEGGDKRKLQSQLYNRILKRIQAGDY
jgi:ribosomal protein L29